MQARRHMGAMLGTALSVCALPGAPARADHRPVLVVPGHPAVPAIVDGVDVGGAVIEGDWGLHRPGRMPRAIYHGTIYDGPLVIGAAPPGYYPATGRRPRYGRHEIVPRGMRRARAPAESFYRAWSTPPGFVPAAAYPPHDPPPVIRAPQLR